MKTIKKKLSMLFMAVIVLAMCGGIDAKAAGGTSSLSVSASSVNVGDTVTVTMSVSADVYASFRMSISYSSSVLEYTGSNKGGDCNGGGGALSVLSEVEGGGTYSISCTFKAISPGSASVSASAVEAIAMETAEAISISGSGTSITVNNTASSGNSGGGSDSNNTGETGSTDGNTDDSGQGNVTATQSGDNSLKSLTISPGTLSPAFQYSTTKYTASVSEDVTSVAIDAQVSNANATVESVTGNTNLEMGENSIQIVVKAENGTTATYTITVTRGGEAVGTEETEEEESEPTDEVSGEGIVINGISYEVSPTLPEKSMPEEFTKTSTTYGGQEVEAYSFPYADLLLLYLNPTAGDEENSDLDTEETGAFYFYNAAENRFFPYINISVGQKYVLVLPLSYSGDTIPTGYQKTELSIGEFLTDGCQLIPGDEQENDGFYLVYGVDQSGTAGWYQYDSVDMSLQRFSEKAMAYETEEEGQNDITAYEEAYTKLENKYKEERSTTRIVMAVMTFALVVAIIVIINLIIWNRKGKRNKKQKKNGEDFDFIDFDDL